MMFLTTCTGSALFGALRRKLDASELRACIMRHRWDLPGPFSLKWSARMGSPSTSSHAAICWRNSSSRERPAWCSRVPSSVRILAAQYLFVCTSLNLARSDVHADADEEAREKELLRFMPVCDEPSRRENARAQLPLHDVAAFLESASWPREILAVRLSAQGRYRSARRHRRKCVAKPTGAGPAEPGLEGVHDWYTP
jgi:hypothetical protein